MLILQDHDEQGHVVGEHAVAESPVTDKHASYVFRHDIDNLSWREIMALDKKDARFFNARPVKHTKIQGELTPENMATKIHNLLECDRQTFLQGEFKGDNTLRIRGKLGATALSTTASL
jgi:hypothetical protein